MIFPNLASIIAEETQGNYKFKHLNIDGYNTLYMLYDDKVIMYDMVNRPIKSIYESNMNNFSGDILICGAGCGFSVFPIKDLTSVKSITIIENDPTVIAMLQPYLPNVTFIEADMKNYVPTTTYDTIFTDIWNDGDNLEKYSETIRYQEFLNPGGYINYLDFDKFFNIVPVTITDIDYTIQGYHKKKTTNSFGDRSLVEYYSDYNEGFYSNLKVRETRVYIRNTVTGITETISVDIEWIGVDGVTPIAARQLVKYLDLDDGLEANEKSRKRLLHKAKGAAIQLIGIEAGKSFMRSYGAEMSLYVEGDKQLLIDGINSSSETQIFKDTLTGILDIQY